MINKFNVGDIVVVEEMESNDERIKRKVDTFGNANVGVGFLSDMIAYEGQTCRITKILERSHHGIAYASYRITADGGKWAWDDSMLRSACEIDCDFGGVEDLL